MVSMQCVAHATVQRAIEDPRGMTWAKVPLTKKAAMVKKVRSFILQC